MKQHFDFLDRLLFLSLDDYSPNNPAPKEQFMAHLDKHKTEFLFALATYHFAFMWHVDRFRRFFRGKRPNDPGYWTESELRNPAAITDDMRRKIADLYCDMKTMSVNRLWDTYVYALPNTNVHKDLAWLAHMYTNDESRYMARVAQQALPPGTAPPIRSALKKPSTKKKPSKKDKQTRFSRFVRVQVPVQTYDPKVVPRRGARKKTTE